jgi:hypothetical protein
VRCACALLRQALFKLSADTDLGVQNGFQLLDRLMKDIVAESHAFDLPAFVPLLRRRIFVANSYTRQFLIGTRSRGRGRARAAASRRGLARIMKSDPGASGLCASRRSGLCMHAALARAL